MKNKLSKDTFIQKFGPMNIIQPNIIYDLKGYWRNSKLNLVRHSKKYERNSAY